MRIFIESDGKALQAPIAKVRNGKQITVAISSLSLGGAERIVLDWANRVGRSFQIHLIVLRNRQKEWRVPDFIRVTRLENKDRMEVYSHLNGNDEKRLAQLLELGRDLASSPNPVCVCHLLRKEERDALAAHGAEVVTVLHNAKDGWPEGVESLQGSSQTIAVSEACAFEIRQHGWDGPISVIRHLPARRTFPDKTREHFREAWNIPLNAKVIGMVGAVKSQKNYFLALQILAQLIRQQDVYLVIVGGPLAITGRAEWEKVVTEAQSLGVRHRLAMPGFIADAEQTLPAFDLVLNTSHFEGLSIATLEALVKGLPVVASRVGGQGEVTSEGLTLLEKDSPIDAWVSKIQENLGLTFPKPSWADFSAYKLWTLAGIARNVVPGKKILFVTANLNSGGAQRSLVNLAIRLNKRAPIAIAVTGNSTESYFYNLLVKEGVEVMRTSDSWDSFKNTEALIDQITALGIASVCFWNVGAEVKLLLVKALAFTKVRFIEVSPGQESFDRFSESSRFGQLIAFSTEEFFDRLDGVVLKYSGYTPESCTHKTVVIPNGVPEAKRVKKDYRIKGNPRIVVNGRIAPTKFILEIIEAVRIVQESIPEAELHFFGGVEKLHQDYGKKVLERSQNDPRIVFHGISFEVVRDLPDYDVYVVLGKDQGCPNALLEALSVGMPSVANNNGGTREQLINGKTGLLVEGTSPKILAQALIQIVSDRVLAEKLGRQGRKHILQAFSMERMVEGYSELLGIEPKRSWMNTVAQWIKGVGQTEQNQTKETHEIGSCGLQ